MMTSIRILAGALLTAILPAQPGSYASFGTACPGYGKGPLTYQAQNFASGNLETVRYPDELAFGVRSNDGQILFNVDFHARSTTGLVESTICALYLDSGAGTPSPTPAARGRLTVGPQAGIYTVYLVPPVPVVRDQTFWISQYDTSRILPSAVDSGTAPSVPTYRRNPAGSANAPWNATSAPRFPAWRLSTCDGRGLWRPLLIGFDAPRVGGRFTLQLHHAAESAPVVLLWGFSDSSWLGLPLPFDLTPLGATGCTLYCSGDVQAPSRTDPCGFARFDVDIPIDARLVGLAFFNQWLILDWGANRLGLVASDAGRGVIGQ
jgi:hypothetical protein